MQENPTVTVIWSVREKNKLEMVLLFKKKIVFESEMQMTFTWRSKFSDKLVCVLNMKAWKGLIISIDEKD